MQSAVWPLSKQQISAGDFIPAEVDSGEGQIRAWAPRHVDERRRDRQRMTRKEQKRSEVFMDPLISVHFWCRYIIMRSFSDTECIVAFWWEGFFRVVPGFWSNFNCWWGCSTGYVTNIMFYHKHSMDAGDDVMAVTVLQQSLFENMLLMRNHLNVEWSS